MAGCDGYVCMGCGKCYGLTAQGDASKGSCMICGSCLPPAVSRCPSCGAPVVKPIKKEYLGVSSKEASENASAQVEE